VSTRLCDPICSAFGQVVQVISPSGSLSRSRGTSMGRVWVGADSETICTASQEGAVAGFFGAKPRASQSGPYNRNLRAGRNL